MDLIEEEKRKLELQQETLAADFKMMDEICDRFLKKLYEVTKKLEKIKEEKR